MAVHVNITVTDGPDKGQSFELQQGEAVLGRSKSDIKMNDTKISGRHCRIHIQGNDVFLEDLNSTNGTFISGRKISGKEPLQNLDEVVIGLTKLSIAIIEELAEFKRANTPLDDQSTKLTPEAEIASPPEGAVYEENDMKKIEDLIQHEIQTFSRWDHPATQEPADPLVKIRVLFKVKQGPEGFTNFTCSKAVSTIGRKDVDIRLNDIDCSRKQCQIEITQGDRIYIRDLASTNGTYVNGKKIAYQEVKPGDLIQIGQTIMEMEIESAQK